MSEILDSGERTTFDSGAVRDMGEGKGRCDLLPLDCIANYLYSLNPRGECGAVINILHCINAFIYDGNCDPLYSALYFFRRYRGWSDLEMILEVSKHYEDGCRKYGERNWEKGIPLHSFIDSALRHLFKYVNGERDEPHDRAFVWNILGAAWTREHKPEMVDLPFAQE